MPPIASEDVLTYPRQEALTRSFRLGLPRAFRIDPTGARVAFIRSAGGRDATGSLWVAVVRDGSLVERQVVDTLSLLRDEAEVPAAERARRERMRETTSGITAFTTDLAVTVAAFSLDGTLHGVDLTTAGAAATALSSDAAVVDPRVSPDGSRVAYVSAGSVFVVDLGLDGAAAQPRLLCESTSDTETWGLADFIAAEELDRPRGLWWLPDSRALLVERVDESAVPVRWISDPANPEREPVPHRYPVAGGPNATVELFRVGLDGTREQITWDSDAFPYLATVEAEHPAGAIISVLSRDQQRQQILELPAGATAATELVVRECRPWLTLYPGVPARSDDGALLEIVADPECDTFRLTSDGRPLTPPGLNISGVVDAGPDGMVVVGSTDPREQHVFRVEQWGAEGAEVVELTTGPSVNAAVAAGDWTVIVTVDGTTTAARYAVHLNGASGSITSLAEEPVVRPAADFVRVGERELCVAVLLPSGHVAGTSLPVVLAPYGGPGHNLVVYSGRAFARDQWLADQGFAVIVADGRGTPGRGPAWDYSISSGLAAAVVQDQVDALRAVASTHAHLDLDRVGIIGWSFGGLLAALAVLDRPDVFHAAVVGAPVSDWALYDTAYTERYLGLPQDNPGGYAETSLIRRADQLERPMMIIHGLSDDNVMVANTLQFSSALLAAGKPHSVLPLTGVTHMTPQEVVAENLLRLQVDFLKTHLQR